MGVGATAGSERLVDDDGMAVELEELAVCEADVAGVDGSEAVVLASASRSSKFPN